MLSFCKKNLVTPSLLYDELISISRTYIDLIFSLRQQLTYPAPSSYIWCTCWNFENFRNKIYLLPSFNITRLRLHPATHLFCKLPPRKQWLWYLRDLARGHRSAKLRCILSFVWLRRNWIWTIRVNTYNRRSPNSNFWAHTLHLCLHRTPNRWTRHPFCWPRPLKANTAWKNLSYRFIVAITLS